MEFNINVIRIPIRPDLWQIVPNFLEIYIDPIIEECHRRGIYCIIDWHAIGNPVKNETRQKNRYTKKDNIIYYEYDSNPNIAKKFWNDASERYKDKENVLFEIFNEPAPDSKDLPEKEISALSWGDYRVFIEEIIDIIRKNSKNLILIGPTNWAYNLSPINENPINRDNIAYSLHPYPVHKDWKGNFELLINKFPLIVTEWAFKEETREDFLRATKESYGNPIIEYMERNKISWVAWCFDFEWGPKMIEKPFSEKRLTKWGDFVLSKIKEYNTQNVKNEKKIFN